MATVTPNPIAMFLGTPGPAELKLDGVEATATNGHVVHFVLSDPVYGAFAPQNAVMPAPNAAGESRLTSTFTPAAVTPPGAVIILSIVDQDTGVTLATAQLTVTAAPAAAPGAGTGAAATGAAPAPGATPAGPGGVSVSAPITAGWMGVRINSGTTGDGGWMGKLLGGALFIGIVAIVGLILLGALGKISFGDPPPVVHTPTSIIGGSIQPIPSALPVPVIPKEITVILKDERGKAGASPSATDARAAAIAACVDASCRR